MCTLKIKKTIHIKQCFIQIGCYGQFDCRRQKNCEIIKRYDTGSSIKPDIKQSQVKIGVAQWQLLWPIFQ